MTEKLHQLENLVNIPVVDVSVVPVVTLAVEVVDGSVEVDVAVVPVLVLSVDTEVAVLAVVDSVDPEVDSVDGLVVDVSVELAVELVDVSVLDTVEPVVPSKEVNPFVSPFTKGRPFRYLYFVPRLICRKNTHTALRHVCLRLSYKSLHLKCYTEIKLNTQRKRTRHEHLHVPK